ncbi:GNAT family N-acetyltransferase [Microbacterium sp. zg.Y1090]|uniref:GNAT family N-acetyltransferase n=1 Tax=Microbacterium TaxID=33882 RepID=UPI00214C207B|nr:MULTISPECIES: GNAT family N-acetyltransferase [unclassified Microbacterium]MCR2811969.1 GNAT family N-acetyltransferase [Microbacterium sp. zg.Y1084]MCR2818592.1 GNAT family N-acetyltransferase [Microbacterium sp. zg.Y1090]MDL5486406.1 GNAT family N-acetyltransferase [Microbacterium sp. zg-Y1211]WIM29595.1 GNAT family N-acetyltransferase [Microbacterium sp. zg-Y1090]
MPHALDDTTEMAVRRVWAERLGVSPAVFAQAEPVFIVRPGLTAAVVVRLEKTVVVAAPELALSALRSLAPRHLLDVGALLTALEPLAPSLFGVATLAFADRGTIVPARSDAVRMASDAEVAAVMSACSTEERDESGLLAMDRRWTTWADGVEPAAAAGYEVWGGGLAHIGVATAPAFRGKGFGAQAAAAAALHAIGDGLVAQWRCRARNRASARLGESLGFVRLGEQIAVDLAACVADVTPEAR